MSEYPAGWRPSVPRAHLITCVAADVVCIRPLYLRATVENVGSNLWQCRKYCVAGQHSTIVARTAPTARMPFVAENSSQDLLPRKAAMMLQTNAEIYAKG